MNAFVDKYKRAVIDSVANTGIFPSVKMAQMILESNSGKSGLATKANNFFGIKVSGNWNGPYVLANDDAPNEKFRKYSNPVGSINDHTAFLIENSRYKNYGVLSAKTPELQAELLQKAGYATSQSYASTIKSLIEKYDLKKLDKLSKQMKTIDTVAIILLVVVVAFISLREFKII